MAQHGKKYIEAAKKITTNRDYPLTEAVKTLKEASFVKFNETVELHARLGIDPRQSGAARRPRQDSARAGVR